MYKWQILFLSTEEIAENVGYQYPHTAQAGAVWHLKSRLRNGISSLSDYVRLLVINEPTEKLVRDSDKVTIESLV